MGIFSKYKHLNREKGKNRNRKWHTGLVQRVNHRGYSLPDSTITMLCTQCNKVEVNIPMYFLEMTDSEGSFALSIRLGVN